MRGCRAGGKKYKATDAVVAGNESADQGGFQVGIRVAHALGRPMVNGIKGLDVDGASEGHILANREISALI